uniref:bifunctional serine/threonine-protein kinase/formylglycine-generating enzyme family protein n=1 Tax=Armatimonas sp. TaxID=1872638 RepID=UPI003753AA97
DTTLEVQRAFKKVRVKDDAERQSVIREARLLVKLGSHPNIVQIYDIIEGDTFVGMVMDWIEGQTLSEYLASKGTLSKSEALAITGEVLVALEFAHSQNILHSDIKPGNVMRGTDGSIRLVDFGVARTLGTHSMGTAMGVTYPFAPPEFFQPPHKLDLRADLWAVGVMLYQLVTARLPFTVEAAQSSNPFAWANAITPCQYAAPPDREIAALLTHVLVPLDQRFPTASTFRVALQAPLPNPAPIPKPFVKQEPTGRLPLLETYKAQLVQIPAGVLKQQTGTKPVYENRAAKGFVAGLTGKMERVKVGDEAVFSETKIATFRMGRTPVTVGMWKEYADTKLGGTMPELPDDYPVWAKGWDSVLEHPIVNVSWEDCKAYADWAGLVLAGELQWEFAASGSNGRVYPWGDMWDANKCQCSKKTPGDAGGTAPVGSFPAGSFGLYDMAGNVWEWCSDWYDSEKKYRVARGGSWYDNRTDGFRCAVRGWGSPDNRSGGNCGFRLSSPLPVP